jgi:2-dehydro-3-deoxygluconokinase
MMDLIAIGETMLRLSVSDGHSLEAAETYRADVAGAESNVASDAARLGLAAGWISRLPDNPLGRKVINNVRQHGVDTSRVIWAPEYERQSTFFVEFAPLPRGTHVIYDRKDSAFSRIIPEEIDWPYVRTAQWLHISGITPALGAGPAATAERAIAQAASAGSTISIDVNYRSQLWTPHNAARGLAPLLSQADVLICALRDAILLFSVPDDAEKATVALHKAFLPGITIVTLGDDGVIAYDGQLYRQHAVPAETLDPIGSGDAFVAGFIAGHLEDGLERGLSLGVGLAALKRTYRGDVVWCSRQDVLTALNQLPNQSIRR